LAQVARKSRIGYYGSPSPDYPGADLIDEFRKRLRALGYVEGENLEFEWRAPGNREAIASEFVRLKVDLIVAGNTANATAARRVTSTIPILIVSGDPVREGLVNSLARPGGNVTGVTPQASDILGKQLELLKLVAPRSARTAILWNPGNRFHAPQVKDAEALVRTLGAEPYPVSAGSMEQLDAAFAEMANLGADSLLILADGAVFFRNQTRIAELAAKHRVPAMHPRREHVLAGGLMSYGTDRRELFRRLAVYADKILKGAKPADLPVEQATTFELVINRKAEKALGIRIPQSVLGRADELIE
jgi:putative ABC transport system substrate-binding protein